MRFNQTAFVMMQQDPVASAGDGASSVPGSVAPPPGAGPPARAPSSGASSVPGSVAPPLSAGPVAGGGVAYLPIPPCPSCTYHVHHGLTDAT